MTARNLCSLRPGDERRLMEVGGWGGGGGAGGGLAAIVSGSSPVMVSQLDVITVYCQC